MSAEPPAVISLYWVDGVVMQTFIDNPERIGAVPYVPRAELVQIKFSLEETIRHSENVEAKNTALKSELEVAERGRKIEYNEKSIVKSLNVRLVTENTDIQTELDNLRTGFEEIIALRERCITDLHAEVERLTKALEQELNDMSAP